jgi:hypothetical protein
MLGGGHKNARRAFGEQPRRHYYEFGLKNSRRDSGVFSAAAEYLRRA